jgi:hypothetical protein
METGTDMDTDTDNPNNNDLNNLMELEHSIDTSDIQTETIVYNYRDAQITKLLDTNDDICELQMDALSLTRRGSTNIYYTNNKLNTNENDPLTNNSTPHNLDNSQTDNDSDIGLQNLTQKKPPRNDRNQPNTNNIDKPNNNPDYKTDTDTDNKETPSSTYRLLSTIPTHLHTTFQTLNNLKGKQIKTKTRLEILTTYKTDGTLPNNLNKTTDCHIILDEDLRKSWVQASRDAAYTNNSTYC